VNCLHNLSIVGHPKLLSWQMSAISMDGQAKPHCLKKCSLLDSINVTCTEPWVKKFLGASNGEELFTSRSYTRMEKINAILFCFLDQTDGTHLGVIEYFILLANHDYALVSVLTPLHRTHCPHSLVTCVLWPHSKYSICLSGTELKIKGLVIQSLYTVLHMGLLNVLVHFT